MLLNVGKLICLKHRQQHCWDVSELGAVQVIVWTDLSPKLTYNVFIGTLNPTH